MGLKRKMSENMFEKRKIKITTFHVLYKLNGYIIFTP